MGFQLSATARREVEALALVELRRLSKRVAADARAASPSGRRASRRGRDFAALWTSRPQGGYGRGVVAYTVGNPSSNAHIVEFGSRTTPEFAPLRRALSRQGLRVTAPAGSSGKRRGLAPRKRRKRRRPRR